VQSFSNYFRDLQARLYVACCVFIGRTLEHLVKTWHDLPTLVAAENAELRRHGLELDGLTLKWLLNFAVRHENHDSAIRAIAGLGRNVPAVKIVASAGAMDLLCHELYECMRSRTVVDPIKADALGRG
jgi:hypothetical protein